jgi:hypothetical protein
MTRLETVASFISIHHEAAKEMIKRFLSDLAINITWYHSQLGIIDGATALAEVPKSKESSL